ncbi:hypothetical protein HanXRQr2_Chr13g0585041 [Helianthus annuus]|uniref:Uncharacterized protein n=1 Tax=Helianthus annuus TaxID=4232 RepID=A0A9K3HBN0_HELAN|nr:hypothetical protein HanXRQr2_Chr13g0585041 [Helianthus annuus]KAJ0848933.1 hypothetical protein HanPSC8_Chr13g0563181 [Helianthus annuus]
MTEASSSLARTIFSGHRNNSVRAHSMVLLVAHLFRCLHSLITRPESPSSSRRDLVPPPSPAAPHALSPTRLLYLSLFQHLGPFSLSALANQTALATGINPIYSDDHPTPSTLTLM